MTNIKLEIKKNKFSIALSGHAGYAEEGKDIVCAGISALSFALLTYLQKAEIYKKVTELEIELGNPDISASCTVHDEAVWEAIDAIMQGYLLLYENYPKNIYFSPNGREDKKENK